MKPHPTDRRENLIHFIQFLFPNAKREDQWIERPKNIFDMANSLWSQGYSLEMENQNERIWLSVSKHSEDKHHDKFCPNGPEVPIAIDELIAESYAVFIALGAKIK